MCSRQCQNVFCVFSLFCCDIFFSKRYRSNKDSPKITYFQLFSVFLWLASIFKGLGESPNACKTALTTKSHLTQRPNDSPNWPFPCLLRMPSVSKLSKLTVSVSFVNILDVFYVALYKTFAKLGVWFRWLVQNKVSFCPRPAGVPWDGPRLTQVPLTVL